MTQCRPGTEADTNVLPLSSFADDATVRRRDATPTQPTMAHAGEQPVSSIVVLIISSRH